MTEGSNRLAALSSTPPGRDRTQVAATLPRVLILGDHLGYGGGVVHGVTSYFLSVLPMLRQTGLRMAVCFLRRPHAAAALLVHEGIEPMFLSAGKFNPFVIFRVARVVRELEFDVIHSAGIKGSLVARIVGLMTGVRVIVHLHDLFYPRGPVRVLQLLFARRTDWGLCLSEAARVVAVRGYGLDPLRLCILHNGIDLLRYRSAGSDAGARIRAELGIAAHAPLIGMIGRFHRVKGQHHLISAMVAIVAALPGAVLVLVGDGPRRARCEALARRLGLLPNIRFAGQRSDVPELLAAFDLVAVPSEQEGLSLVAIEAQAAGKPVVAFAVGGLPEVVTDGVDGRLVPAGDIPGMARAISDLLASPETMRRLGESAALNAERFSLEHHVRKLLGCYVEAAS